MDEDVNPMQGTSARRYLITAMALTLSAGAWAQTSAPEPSRREPVGAGAIIMPPKDQPPPAKGPDAAADPNIANPPAARAMKKETISKRKRSKDSTCRGSAELCKQTSPR
jgi:hypothetical protein